MVDACHAHGMLDVVHEPADPRHIEAGDMLSDEPVHLERRRSRAPPIARPDGVGLRPQPLSQRLVFAPEAVVQEHRVEVDPDDAARPGDRLELLVREVARMVRQRAAGRM